jgi:hypothetical protein
VAVVLVEVDSEDLEGDLLVDLVVTVYVQIVVIENLIKLVFPVIL